MEFFAFTLMLVVVVALVMGFTIAVHRKPPLERPNVPNNVNTPGGETEPDSQVATGNRSSLEAKEIMISDMDKYLEEKFGDSDSYTLPTGRYVIAGSFTVPAGKKLLGESKTGTVLQLGTIETHFVRVDGALEFMTIDGNNHIHAAPIAGTVLVSTNGVVNDCFISNNAAKPVHFPFVSSNAQWLYDLYTGDYPNIVTDVFEGKDLNIFVDGTTRLIDFLSDCKTPGTGGCFGNDPGSFLYSKSRAGWANWNLKNWVTDYGRWAEEKRQYIPYETEDYAFGAAATTSIMFIEGSNATVQNNFIYNGKFGIIVWGGDDESRNVRIVGNTFNNTLCDAITTISNITYRDMVISSNSFCRVGYLCFNGSGPQVAGPNLIAFNLTELNDIPAAAFYSINCKYENLQIEFNSAGACLPFAGFGLPLATGTSYGVCGNTIDFVSAEVASGVTDPEGGFTFANNNFAKSQAQVEQTHWRNDPFAEDETCQAGNALNIAYGSSGGRIEGNKVYWETKKGDALSIHNDESGTEAKSRNIIIRNNQFTGTVDKSNLET